MGQEEIENQQGVDAATTQPGEGAAVVEIIQGVIVVTMPSAETQTPVPARQQ